jgi:MFS transporter, FSR family, fosmidomycin resistance protein
MASEIGVLEVTAQSSTAYTARRGVALLVLMCVGHFVIDLYSSALSVFQPLLAQKLSITLTWAGVLGGMIVFSGSTMQPAYGYLSDRFHTRLFAALAPAVAAVFLSLLGAAPGVGWAIVLVALGGAGIAAFHPQASSQATAGLDKHRGRWMAVFISSGSLGLAVGPMYFSTLLGRVGLERSYWAMIPGVLITLVLLAFLPEAPRQASHARNKFDWPALQTAWKPLTILYLLVFIRSIVQISFTQFLPLYLSRERGFPLTKASYALSLFLGAGALGGFLGGQLADRFGGRRVILASMLGSTPLLALFFFSNGTLALAGLGLGGLVLLCTGPVNVVMAQELAPTQAGTISALMMGFAWGTAGMVFIPITGWASDLSSMHVVLSSFLVFPTLGFLLGLKLPK